MINLLSIDWDYFFDVGTDDKDNENFRMRYFSPICTEDYDPYALLFAWEERYAKRGEKLRNIKIRPVIYKILESIPPNAVVYVVKSHRHAYEIFNRYVKRKDRINFLTFDHHSDTELKNKNEPVHCGNWLAHFMLEHYSKGDIFRWVTETDKYTHSKVLQLFTDITDVGLDTTKWNIVVIARSDVWSPPHLDDDFIKIFKPFIDNRKSKKFIEAGVWQSRYDERFNHEVKELQKPQIEDERLKKLYSMYMNMVDEIQKMGLNPFFEGSWK